MESVESSRTSHFGMGHLQSLDEFKFMRRKSSYGTYHYHYYYCFHYYHILLYIISYIIIVIIHYCHNIYKLRQINLFLIPYFS